MLAAVRQTSWAGRWLGCDVVAAASATTGDRLLADDRSPKEALVQPQFVCTCLWIVARDTVDGTVVLGEHE